MVATTRHEGPQHICGRGRFYKAFREQRGNLVIEGHSHKRILLPRRLAYHVILGLDHTVYHLAALPVRSGSIHEHRPERLVSLPPESYLPQILHTAILHSVNRILPELFQRLHVVH